MKIVTTYVPHPSSNVGVIVARAQGKQKTTRWDSALSTDANHGAAAGNLIMHMFKSGAWQGSDVAGFRIAVEDGAVSHDSNESGTVHVFKR